MDAGPDRVLDVRAASGHLDSGFDEVVEGRLQMVERSWLVTGRMLVRGRECGVEETGFLACEREIRLADGPEPESRAGRRVRPRAYVAHAARHALSEIADRPVTDGSEEGVAVGEVPIRGVGDDADHARHLAEHDRVRAARSGQLEAGLDERGAHGAARTRSPAHRGFAGVPPSRGPLLACRHVADSSGQCPQMSYSGQRPHLDNQRGPPWPAPPSSQTQPRQDTRRTRDSKST